MYLWLIYYYRQETFRRNGVALIDNGRVQNVVLGCNLRNGNEQRPFCQGKAFSITALQVYAPITKETEVEQCHEDPQTLLEHTPKKKKKRCPFHHRGMECRSRKWGDTWSNRKLGLGEQNEAGQRLTEFCQDNALAIANTLFQQHKRWLTWTSDGQYQNQTDYILCCWTQRSSIQSAKTRPGADCGSDHEYLIAKFRLTVNKIGKTTRPLRYDLNQIPYDRIMEVTNRFKGLDLIECLQNYGQRFVTYRRWWSKSSLRKRNSEREKGCLGGLTNSWEKNRS